MSSDLYVVTDDIADFQPASYVPGWNYLDAFATMPVSGFPAPLSNGHLNLGRALGIKQIHLSATLVIQPMATTLYSVSPTHWARTADGMIEFFYGDGAFSQYSKWVGYVNTAGFTGGPSFEGNFASAITDFHAWRNGLTGAMDADWNYEAGSTTQQQYMTADYGTAATHTIDVTFDADQFLMINLMFKALTTSEMDSNRGLAAAAYKMNRRPVLFFTDSDQGDYHNDLFHFYPGFTTRDFFAPSRDASDERFGRDEPFQRFQVILVIDPTTGPPGPPVFDLTNTLIPGFQQPHIGSVVIGSNDEWENFRRFGGGSFTADNRKSANAYVVFYDPTTFAFIDSLVPDPGMSPTWEVISSGHTYPEPPWGPTFAGSGPITVDWYLYYRERRSLDWEIDFISY